MRLCRSVTLTLIRTTVLSMRMSARGSIELCAMDASRTIKNTTDVRGFIRPLPCNIEQQSIVQPELRGRAIREHESGGENEGQCEFRQLDCGVDAVKHPER